MYKLSKKSSTRKILIKKPKKILIVKPIKKYKKKITNKRQKNYKNLTRGLTKRK